MLWELAQNKQDMPLRELKAQHTQTTQTLEFEIQNHVCVTSGILLIRKHDVAPCNRQQTLTFRDLKT